MADVRSMLQSERSNRKIKHPHAAYTSTKQLICSACRCPIKSASLWENHLRSEGHLTVVKKAKASRVSQGGHDSPVPSKKRKAETDDEQDNKRVRSSTAASVGGAVGPTSNPQESRHPSLGTPTTSQLTAGEDQAPAVVESLNHSSTPSTTKAVNEDEWSAFERDMAAMEQTEAMPPRATSTLQAMPTISALPMTAEQLAAQAREEQSVQKGNREAELEEEREDASRQMDEELGQMEQLDDRMRKWREKKAALQIGGSKDKLEVLQGTDAVPDAGTLRRHSSKHVDDDDPASSDDDDGDDDDDDDEDPWRGLGGL